MEREPANKIAGLNIFGFGGQVGNDTIDGMKGFNLLKLTDLTDKNPSTSCKI